MKIEPISFSVFNQVCIYLTRPTKQQVMLCKPNIKRREWKSLKANKLKKKKKKATNQPSHTHTLCLVAQLCPTLGGPMDCSLPGSSVHGDSPGKNTGVDCHALLQGIFPTQGSNPGLLNYRLILYILSHQGSPWILEQAAMPFSRGSSQPRNWTGVSGIAGRFFASWATREHTHTYRHTYSYLEIEWELTTPHIPKLQLTAI